MGLSAFLRLSRRSLVMGLLAIFCLLYPGLASEIFWNGYITPATPFDLKVSSSGFYNYIPHPLPKKERPLTLGQVFGRAKEFHYQPDAITLDNWQTTEQTKELKQGDCEDISLWLYGEMIRNGYENVRLVIGKFRSTDPRYHAWVQYQDESNLTWILDPILQNNVWNRLELAPTIYQPWFSFDYQNRYRHQHYAL